MILSYVIFILSWFSGVTFGSLLFLLELEARTDNMCQNLMVLPILDERDEGNYECWTNHSPLVLKDGIPWAKLEGEPNGAQFQNCTTFSTTGTLYDRACENAAYCFYCQVVDSFMTLLLHDTFSCNI